MKSRSTFLLLTLLACMGCGDQPKQKVKTNVRERTEIKRKSIHIQTMDPSKGNTDTSTVLSIKPWPVMTAFNKTILMIKDGDSINRSYGEQLKLELSAMRISMPSRLNTATIKQHLSKMERQVSSLQQTIARDSTNRKAVAGTAQQFLREYADFSASVRKTLTTKGGDSIPGEH